MNRTKFISLTASMVFVLSCSFGDNGGNDYETLPSSSSVTLPSSSSVTEILSVSSSSSDTRSCNNFETRSSSSVIGGTFIDARDNNIYKWVQIGEQVWMAENLNYDASIWTAENANFYGSSSRCYNDNPANCDKYGKLYGWTMAMWLPQYCFAGGDYCTGLISPKHQGICPDGWHLPSDEEWTILENYAGGASIAGGKLKATSGWNNCGNGTDDYGFSALPGIYSRFPDYDDNEDNLGYVGNWWSATQYNDVNVYCRSMYDYDDEITSGPGGKASSTMYVRCVMN